MLEQAVFSFKTAAPEAWRKRDRDLRTVEIVLVAKAWRGSAMKGCLAAFARDLLAADREELALPDGRRIAAGGASHVVGFVGHNGLMDLPRDQWPFAAIGSATTGTAGASSEPSARGERAALPPKGWFVLACKSDSYFAPELSRPNAVKLLATRQFMAPEAYTLAALLEHLATADSSAGLRSAAAAAYAEYQKITPKAAAGIFTN